MIRVRKADERGVTQLDWLDSRHTFSFGSYVDFRYKGFRDLVVINEDRIRPAGGFGMHPHRDMEILTVVLEGSLEHRDSLGNGTVIHAGDLQRMTAGTGIVHREFNPSTSKRVHLLQIWILPERAGLEPAYEQRRFRAETMPGRFRLIASPDGEAESLLVHQDVRLLAASPRPGDEARYELRTGRHGWLQVARGTASANGIELEQGDGAAISDETTLAVGGGGETEVLLFDLA